MWLLVTVTSGCHNSEEITKDRNSREKELQERVTREVYSKDSVNRIIESLEKNIQESQKEIRRGKSLLEILKEE